MWPDYESVGNPDGGRDRDGVRSVGAYGDDRRGGDFCGQGTQFKHGVAGYA